MSWQDYVTNYLVNTQNGETNAAEHAAIVGNQDGAVWAKSDKFELKNSSVALEKDDGTTENVTVNEFANLKDAFDNKGATNNKGGVRLNGEKYYIVSFDEDRNVMYLKKNGGGAAVAKSNLGFVISTFNSKSLLKDKSGTEAPQNPGVTNSSVESLQTFLTANNL